MKNEVIQLDEVVRSNAGEMESFFEVPYEVDVHVGKTRLTVRQILELQDGDVVRLDRQATDNVLLMIENIPLVSAEVVLTKSGTGARIVEVI